MCKPLILPQFDYGSIAWDNCSGTLSNMLEHAQKPALEAIRIIIGAVKGTSDESCIKNLDFAH